MNQNTRDALSGGTILVLGTALLVAIPHQVETLEGDTLTPAFVPSAMAWIIVVLAALLLGRGLMNRHAGDRGSENADPRRYLKAFGVMALCAGTCIAYVTSISVLGYLLATALALGVLSYLFGHRIWWQIALLMAITPPFVFYFFRYTMLVLLPQGTLFE